MFHHANRDNAVELAGELPIVQLTKLDKVGNAGSFGMSTRYLDLLGRNVDRSYTGARFAREMNGEAAPAGADLGDGHAGL